MNYQEAYHFLVEDIKYKLSKLYLDDTERNKYLSKLDAISLLINNNSDDFAYYEAFLKISSLESTLGNLINKHSDLILPPYETEKFLNDKIKKDSRELRKYEHKKDKIKARIASCALTGSILLTMGAYTVIKDREEPREKLYLTRETTYYDNTATTHSKSTYEKERESEVVIKKITPWHLTDTEAYRDIYTYHINNMTYSDIVNNKNYEEVIANLSFEERTESMPLANLSGIFHYSEPIYEVTEISQKDGKYVISRPILSNKAVTILLSELLVYLLIMNINEGPLLESILKDTKELNSTKRIIASKDSTIKVLKKQKTMKK